MSEDLRIDKDVLQSASNDYVNYAKNMASLKRKMDKAVSDIRQGWKSNAGDEFFKKYDEQWVKNLDDYTIVIEHMAKNMIIAKNCYQPLFDEAEQLRL